MALFDGRYGKAPGRKHSAGRSDVAEDLTLR